MGEKSNDDVKRGFATSAGPLIPVLVPIGDQGKQMPGQQPALWLVWVRWMQYYSIQLRWDVERFLARCFNRRWGGL